MSRGATASDDAVVVRAAAVLGLVWLGAAVICGPAAVTAAAERGRPSTTRWRPSTLNVLFFAVSAVDGAFGMTLSLLLVGSLAVGSAMLAAGLLLALQRLAVVVLGPTPHRADRQRPPRSTGCPPPRP